MVNVLEETSVQWILSKNPEHLSEILQMPLKRCLGTEFTTKFGRLDFIFDLGGSDLLILELETYINSSSKFEHCTNQVLNYLNLKTEFPTKNLKVGLVYAEEKTPDNYHHRLKEFTNKYGIILRKYSMQRVQQMYNAMVDQLHLTSGVSLSRAVALGVTSLGWLKKFIALYFDENGNTFKLLSWSELKNRCSSSTNFYVLKRLAEDFELIQARKYKNRKILELTEVGGKFRDQLYWELHFHSQNLFDQSSQELTLSQRRLLLEILINGNFTKLKVNIFHFLRFIQLTEGSWLPKNHTKLTKAEQQYLNDIFRTSYNSRTLKDIVQQTCTFCIELGLVEKLTMPEQLYDKVIFTSLGSRVYHYFEQLLSVERERYQIPMQIIS
jgi:hypothetical protein